MKCKQHKTVARSYEKESEQMRHQCYHSGLESWFQLLAKDYSECHGDQDGVRTTKRSKFKWCALWLLKGGFTLLPPFSVF